MQLRIKNDLDGLGVPDCHGLFSYLAADFENFRSREKPYFKGF